MKILYGVQGTGNGHISRANAMADAFKFHPEIEITWLLSGRDKKKGCGDIQNYQWREGLTFIVKNGRIRPLETLRQINITQFFKDIREIDLSGYDHIICDYEPVIAQAAKKRGIPVTGIGHQYAFLHDIPCRGDNPLARFIMRNYAPTSLPVGLHWHHFGFPILPPILDIELPLQMPDVISNKVIVYLPFENHLEIIDLFKVITDFEFYIYHPELKNTDTANIHTRAISRLGFKQDLINARHVITNSGFELISECLQIGKRILTRPLKGQMEQLSNARALDELAYATVTSRFKADEISKWLKRDDMFAQIKYPNVAARLALWIANSQKESVDELAQELWSSPIAN